MSDSIRALADRQRLERKLARVEALAEKWRAWVKNQRKDGRVSRYGNGVLDAFRDAAENLEAALKGDES
jgi:hypothetical protein